MKVAFDTGPLDSGDKVRGVGAYTRELLSALEAESKKVKDIEIVRLSSEEIRANHSKYDVVHIPYFNPYFLTVPKLDTKVVITIHDVISLIYPKHYPSGIRGRIRLEIQKSRLRSVDAVITVSNSSKKDIVRFLDVPEDKIYVIYSAASDKFKKLSKDDSLLKSIKQKYKLPDKFVLYTGDVNYNKNIPTLIKACIKSKVSLVIVGKQAKVLKDGSDTDLKDIKGPKDALRYVFNKPHPELMHYKELSELLNKPNVSCLGFIPEDDLVALYNLATVYCQPSYAEGFGFPIIEALMCDTPVITSRTQALVEIGGEFVTRFDPNSINDLSTKLNESISRPKILSQKQIKALKGKYNWAKSAREIIEVYKSKI